MGYNHRSSLHGLLLLLILGDVLAGDLTYTNCPSSFSLTTANATSDANVLLSQRGASLYSAYLTSQNTQRIENVVVQGNTPDLINYILVLSIPYILFALLFLVGFCTAIACCLFDKSCPPC